MSFTELWRCKKCNVLPDILVRGKNFLIKCKPCNSRRTEVWADSLDEVVSRWNEKNDPGATSTLEGIKAWPGLLRDWFDFQVRRYSFTPAEATEEETQPAFRVVGKDSTESAQQTGSSHTNAAQEPRNPTGGTPNA
jgi:hypothetical protein